MNARQKADILRIYERYCYQISMYLLKDEELSCEAVKTTFLQLAVDPIFFETSPSIQKAQIKRLNFN